MKNRIKKVAWVHIQGGNVQASYAPAGVELHVLDFDNGECGEEVCQGEECPLKVPDAHSHFIEYSGR